MQVKFYAFGNLRRYTPGMHEQLDLEVPEGSTVADLLERFGITWGEVGVIAVNGKLSDETHRLQPGDKVESFSPIGGG